MLSHPLAILPVATITGAYFGRYSPQEITELQAIPLFLQGSTDQGGSDLFAATIALYVTFGILASIYLTLRMRTQEAASTYLGELRRTAWDVRFHIFWFIIGGIACWSYDSLIGPNDFRNMFLFALVVYVSTIPFVTAIGRRRMPLVARLVIAPLLVYAWLWLGWDGNTAKAGQILSAGQDPGWRPRSARHRVMLAWHQTMDRVLGDW